MRWPALLLLIVMFACGGDVASERRPSERLSPVAAMADVETEGFERALGPRAFAFPEDHGPHERFKLEWWYFVGNLATVDGRRFGFQLTFFRQAMAPETPERGSAWATAQLYMAHFALSDVDGGRFHSFERVSRGALGLAGARAAPFEVRLEDWRAASAGSGLLPLELRAQDGEVALELTLTNAKPLVLQGEAGLSRKSAEPGSASYYYSFTRLPASGTVRLGESSWEVTGDAWLDREWSTSGLGDDHLGWDWFALQLDNGRDLMCYRLRRRAGGDEPFSHGALVEPGGGKRHLRREDFELTVLDHWRSPRGSVYPSRWRLWVPGELDLEIEPLLADQELDVSFRYWEGAVTVRGIGDSRAVSGRGYVELVGYDERTRMR